MNYIALLKAFVALLPVVVDLVKQLDAIGGGEGTGKDKLQLVIDAVRTAFEQARETGVSWASLEPMIRSAVEAILKIVRR